MTDLKVGDFISAFTAGYHVVIDFTTNDAVPAEMCVVYQKIADSNGNPSKSVAQKVCHHAYCRKITPEVLDNAYVTECEIVKKKYVNLRQLQLELEKKQNESTTNSSN